MGNVGLDFDIRGGTQSYNISSDASASGTTTCLGDPGFEASLDHTFTVGQSYKIKIIHGI